MEVAEASLVVRRRSEPSMVAIISPEVVEESPAAEEVGGASITAFDGKGVFWEIERENKKNKGGERKERKREERERKSGRLKPTRKKAREHQCHLNSGKYSATTETKV